MLHQRYVLSDLLASLATREYQVIADWTTSALVTRHSARKGKTLTDLLKSPEGDLSLSLWIKATFNLGGALCSIGFPTSGCLTPHNAASHTAHADQLHVHTSFIIQCVNEHYNWSALQQFNREIRDLKAAVADFDIGNPDAVFRTFQRIIGPLAALAS